MFFTLTTFALVSGLSPDVKRNSYLANFEDSDIVTSERPFLYSNYDENSLTHFCNADKNNIFLKSISNYLQNENLQKEVLINTFKTIENLSEFFIDNIDVDSIYTSSYGTVLIDFEKDESLFSIEVGTKSIGYFSEINSITDEFCEENFIDSEENFNLSIGKLNSDFSNFYSKI